MNELASHEPVAYHGHREPSSRPAEMSPVGDHEARNSARPHPQVLGPDPKTSTCGTQNRHRQPARGPVSKTSHTETFSVEQNRGLLRLSPRFAACSGHALACRRRLGLPVLPIVRGPHALGARQYLESVEEFEICLVNLRS